MGQNRSSTYRACSSKERHPTEDKAQSMIKEARARGYRNADHLRAYECRDCGGFHLTSQPAHVSSWTPSAALRAAQGGR